MAPLSPLPSALPPSPLPSPLGGVFLNPAPDNYALITDLYQLTMGACYVRQGLDQRRASFELFTRRLPEHFGYLIAMGLAQALEYLENLRVSAGQIEALKGTGLFDSVDARFWDLLADCRFSGDVWAVPEGTAVFAHQPILRIEAPLWQAQLVETYLLNVINYQTLVATRAARLRDVAGTEAMLLEFGSRRAFSPQAALWAARAALAAGFDATSNVLAALALGRKPAGTMAHALVMALAATQGSESQAFAAFHQSFPQAPLLIDTYDAIAAARSLAQAQNLADPPLAGVRLDSGDLVTQSRQIRELLPGVPIFASGDLDEGEIARLRGAGACIDGYGVGTKLVTGTPVNGVYKLVEIDGIAVMKAAPGKTTYPGRKQVFRALNRSRDILGLADEPVPEGFTPLLQPMMLQGQRTAIALQPLDAIAHRTREAVLALGPEARDCQSPGMFPVDLSSGVQALLAETQARPH
jgi:nicotinate phosphoribosyltransferase